ncbi:thiolase family protein [Vagococcus entomophilus]
MELVRKEREIMLESVVIVSVARTPIGKYKGSLKDVSATELGKIAVQGALKKGNIAPELVQQVIFGNVLSAGLGQNVARQIALKSGIPYETPAMTINEVCGSGLKSVILGKQSIQLGEAQVVVVGGTENMSQAPYLIKKTNPEDEAPEPIDSMFHDGLHDAFYDVPMGVTAEVVSEKFNITREAQDAFAFKSQKRAIEAQRNGKFEDEIVPVILDGTSYLEQDESIRANTSLEKLASLRTIFKENGTVTAGNASSINDGAAAIVLMSKKYAETNQIPYLAVLGEHSEVGLDPMMMGYSPYAAIKTLSKKSGISLEEVDLFEINEAFASQSLAVREHLAIPEEKINIHGGAIALGHPIGASGARILVSLVHELEQENKQCGVASLCIGGGLGVALMIKR